MAGKRKPQPPEEEGAPAWMNTYGDMVTLLLTFFVLLFSFSTIDAQKWEQIVSSLSGTPYVAIQSIDPGEVHSETDPVDDTSWDVPKESTQPTPEASNELDESGKAERERRFEELYQSIKTYIRINSLEAVLKADKNDDKILIRITDRAALFDSGKDDIRPDAKVMLTEVSAIIEKYDDLIETIWVEGHTDSDPINTAKFKNNMQLSQSRAYSVWEFMTGIMDIDPAKIVPQGFGEYRPVDTNETEAGKANNRRVDFVIQGMLEGFTE